MKHVKREGLILSSRPFFESDRLLTVFSPSHGKIRLLVKRAEKRPAGGLDIFQFVRFECYQGRQFLYVTQYDVETSFLNLRISFDRLSSALYLVDIVRKATAFEQPNLPMCRLFFKCLLRLDRQESIPEVLQFFYDAFLKIEGIWDPEETGTISKHRFFEKFEVYSGCRPEPVWLTGVGE